MGEFITITPESARELIEKEPEITILDIRPNADFKREHIPGAVNLDYDGHQFQSKVEKLDKNQPTSFTARAGLEVVTSWKKNEGIWLCGGLEYFGRFCGLEDK